MSKDEKVAVRVVARTIARFRLPNARTDTDITQENTAHDISEALADEWAVLYNGFDREAFLRACAHKGKEV